MRIKTGYYRAVYFAVAAIFILIMAAAFVFTHRMYEKSLKADIFIHSRELERTIWRAVSGEYQRFYFLAEAGKALLSEISDENLKDRIETLSGLYGPAGEFSHIISAAGYLDPEDSARQHFFDLLAGDWTTTEYQLKFRTSNRDVNFFKGKTEDEWGTFLLVSSKDGGISLLFEIDTEGFRTAYLEPAAVLSLPDYQFEWIRFDNEDEKRSFKDESHFDADKYYFRPLRAVIGLKPSDDSLVIPVPGRGMAVDDSGKPEGKVGGPMFIDEPDMILVIRGASGSFYYETERRAAVSYFETMLILLLIGISFLLLFFQFGKYRQMRIKEREFVASVTHELRTPLTVIQSAADNLSTGIVPPEKLTAYSNLIIEQSGRLGKMIEEILLFSRMEDKKLKQPVPVVIYFPEVLTELKSTLGAIASAEGVLLQWNTSGLPPACRGDLETIMLVARNLVLNAVFHAYGDSGGTVRILMKLSIPGSLVLSVEDDGRGIEPRDLKHIYDPFYRDSVSRQRQEKGSGLGLFIAKRKAETAGGRLTAESPYLRINGQKAGGCRFTLSLPCTVESGE
ncbi:MAG: HAMP domain-containing histidine kinase [Spirochaetales bacterium]|nr:HAMP domain-containing histidine kinase [Spirochaetales bacterium]